MNDVDPHAKGESALRAARAPDDSGLFEHQPGTHYLHVLREVLLTYRTFIKQAAAKMGVSGAQLEALRQLALAGGRSSTSTLARELAVDPAAVTRLVAGLERIGLVTRENDERDGRRRPVVLTPAGRDLMIEMHARAHEYESVLRAAVDEESIDNAVRVLQTIRTVFDPGALRRQNATTGGGPQ